MSLSWTVQLLLSVYGCLAQWKSISFVNWGSGVQISQHPFLIFSSQNSNISCRFATYIAMGVKFSRYTTAKSGDNTAVFNINMETERDYELLNKIWDKMKSLKEDERLYININKLISIPDYYEVNIEVQDGKKE